MTTSGAANSPKQLLNIQTIIKKAQLSPQLTPQQVQQYRMQQQAIIKHKQQQQLQRKQQQQQHQQQQQVQQQKQTQQSQNLIQSSTPSVVATAKPVTPVSFSLILKGN